MDSSQEISACAQQKIVIPNSHNEKLVGLIHETGSREIVVLCHGFGSNKRKKGSALIVFDFSGRVLTVHGSDDETVHVEDAMAFAKIIANHKLEIVEGADHCYTKYQSQLVSTVMEFIKTIVKN